MAPETPTLGPAHSAVAGAIVVGTPVTVVVDRAGTVVVVVVEVVVVVVVVVGLPLLPQAEASRHRVPMPRAANQRVDMERTVVPRPGKFGDRSGA